MKLTNLMTIAAIAVATSLSASAKDKVNNAKADSGRSVTVYYNNGVVDSSVGASSRALAAKMFANVGVNLHWQCGSPSKPEANSIVVEFVDGTPAAFKPGAMAYALPYEGVHIRVMWDRIQSRQNSREVLAHVMVHEITHILQGEARHSATGIMKANWSKEDMFAMASKPLSFTDEDVELIFRGMDNREARAAGASTLALTTPGALTTTAAVTAAK